MVQREKFKNEIIAELTKKAGYRIALPAEGHIDDFTGLDAHLSTGKNILGNMREIEFSFPYSLLEELSEIAGRSGYIERIDPLHDQVTLLCACGASFIVSLSEFTSIPPRINPAKVKPTR